MTESMTFCLKKHIGNPQQVFAYLEYESWQTTEAARKHIQSEEVNVGE